MAASWYVRTQIAPAAALNLADTIIPERITAIQTAIAAGQLTPAQRRRKIGNEKGRRTRLTRWLGGR